MLKEKSLSGFGIGMTMDYFQIDGIRQDVTELLLLLFATTRSPSWVLVLTLELLCHDGRGPPPDSSQGTAQKAYLSGH